MARVVEIRIENISFRIDRLGYVGDDEKRNDPKLE